MLKKINNRKVAFIHGRPKGHPIHGMYADLVSSQFFYEDRLLRWQDLDVSKVRRYVSWFVNAFFFKNKKEWNVYLTECVRIPQLIQKRLHLIKSNQKLIALMADESLYFTHAKIYPKLTQKLMKLFWGTTDAIICIGEYQAELAKEILSLKHHKKIYTIFNGVSQERLNLLNKIKPDLESSNIIFIGNISSDWRVKYKGLDIMLDAFEKSLKKMPNITFTIIGFVDDNIKQKLLTKYPETVNKKIFFKGQVNKIDKELSKYSLMLHCARGDSFPTTNLEAMSAGLPCIVSNQTGTKQFVKELGANYIVEIDVELISERIINYFNLSLSKKIELSNKAKKIVENYTEDNAKKEFLKVFNLIINE